MPRGTPDPARLFRLSRTGLLPSLASAFQPLIPLILQAFFGSPLPQLPGFPDHWFGLFRVRSPLLTESLLFSFPAVTKMFQFTAFPPIWLWIHHMVPGLLLRVGSPIRISTGQWLFAPHRGFSQLITSFVGSWCLGIHPMPLLA